MVTIKSFSKSILLFSIDLHSSSLKIFNFLTEISKMALSASLNLRIGAIFILGSISLIGILIPLVVSEAVFKSDVFHVIKATAAGVMLGLCLVSGQLTHYVHLFVLIKCIYSQIHLMPEANEVLLEAVPDYPLCFALTGLGVMLVLAVEQMTISYINKMKSGRSHRHHSFSVELSRATQSDKRTENEADAIQTGNSDACCDGHKSAVDAAVMHGHDHSHVHNEVSAFDDGSGSPASHDHSHKHNVDDVEAAKGSCGVHTANDNCCKEGLVHYGHSNAGCSHTIVPEESSRHNHQHDHDHSALVFQDVLKAHSFRDMMTAYALELSTATHSVVIGVGLGASTTYSEVVILLAAISFHQLLEGLGLGTMVANSRSALGTWKVISFVIIFSLTVSVGIVIGILTSEQQDEQSQQVVKGVFSSLAAGSMLYAALAEMTGQAFNRPELEDRFGLKTLMILGYMVGFGGMAVIGIWA